MSLLGERETQKCRRPQIISWTQAWIRKNDFENNPGIRNNKITYQNNNVHRAFDERRVTMTS